MEPADQLAARIREASGFFPREQLALSTQCGFASAGPGNAISVDGQENKMRLVAEGAQRVSATGGGPARSRLPGKRLLPSSGQRPGPVPGPASFEEPPL